MGVPSVQQLFSERHYADLEGGILEGFGRLLKFDLKVRRLVKVDTLAKNCSLSWQLSRVNALEYY